MTRRVASLWLPRFATDRLSRRRSGWSAEPLAVAVSLAGRRVVLAANAAAEAGGVRAGLPLADARALILHLQVAEHEPAGARRLLDRLAQWAERYTPWTAVDHGDEGAGAGLWLDVTGSTHLFGGEAALLEDLVRRLGRQGFLARAALADTAAAAWALARYGAPEDMPIAAAGESKAALEGLPVEALRLGAAEADGLVRLGLRCIGDLYGLPRGSLARRFGRHLLERLDQALGAAPEPISPRRPVTPHCVRRRFGEPIATAESIAAALRQLLRALKPLLAAGGMGARRVELICHRVDDTRQGLEIGTSRPANDPDHLFRLFQLHLERIDPGFGIEAMTLIASAAEPIAMCQPELAGRGAAAGDLAGLVDRIGVRLGAQAVRRLDPRDSHWPERAQIPVPVFAERGTGAWPEDKARPPSLLPRPEPIEAMAVLPDSPPAQFRWRRRLHRVRRAEGPERIAPEWWCRRVPAARDYYRVEDEQGRRFWLFREAPDGEPAAAPRWFLHGL